MLLADGPAGYARLSRALSLGHLAGEKGAPQFAFADAPELNALLKSGAGKGASIPDQAFVDAGATIAAADRSGALGLTRARADASLRRPSVPA